MSRALPDGQYRSKRSNGRWYRFSSARPSRSRAFVGSPNDQRDLRVAGREDDGVVEVEMLAMPSRGVSGAKRADDGDGLVETTASSTRVDTTDLDLVAIFTARTDAEHESSRSELVNG